MATRKTKKLKQIFRLRHFWTRPHVEGNAHILKAPTHSIGGCKGAPGTHAPSSLWAGGAPTAKMGVPIYYFCHFSPKTAWNWRNLYREGGGASLAPPLGSTNAESRFFYFHSVFGKKIGQIIGLHPPWRLAPPPPSPSGKSWIRHCTHKLIRPPPPHAPTFRTLPCGTICVIFHREKKKIGLELRCETSKINCSKATSIVNMAKLSFILARISSCQITGWVRLIRNGSLTRFLFNLSRISNLKKYSNSNYAWKIRIRI